MNALTEKILLPVGELDRTTYIGGSDCAAILGLSAWGTPLTVYKDKIGEGEPVTVEKQKFFNRRKRQEPIVIEQLYDERGVKIVAINHRYRHPEHDFLAAEIDFEFEVTPEIVETCPGIPPALIGTIQNGEIKTSHPWSGAKFGEEGTDDIPIQYCAQSMHGMAVTNRDITLYAVMTGFDQFATYVLHRDQEVIDGILEKELHFWHDHVLAQVPPDPLTNDDLALLFARYNGRPVDLDETTFNAYQRIQHLRKISRDVDEEEKELKFQIGLYVAKAWGLSTPEAAEDNAALNYLGEKIARWNKQSRSGLNAKALTKAYPDIAQQFQTTSYFRVLR